MQLSKRGLGFIQRYEKFVPTVYKDAGGFDTVGYGHKVRPEEVFDEPISMTRALQLLDEDAAEAVAGVNKHVEQGLTQNQFDALVSFTFNVGVGAFRNSTLLKRINAGLWIEAALEFPKWRYSNGKELKGLLIRRFDEARAFLL